MRMVPKWMWGALAPAVVVCLMLSSRAAQAQPPRQTGQLARARQACDDAASRAGYRVMRRDRETVNGSAYKLPMHVSHGTTESDLTCNYDTQRGVAYVPPYADQRSVERRTANGAVTDQRGVDRRTANGGATDQRAARLCENFVNKKRGYQVLQVGTPALHGRNLWDVPLTVRRNGRGDVSVTCRYNAASNKLSLR